MPATQRHLNVELLHPASTLHYCTCIRVPKETKSIWDYLSIYSSINQFTDTDIYFLKKDLLWGIGSCISEGWEVPWSSVCKLDTQERQWCLFKGLRARAPKVQISVQLWRPENWEFPGQETPVFLFYSWSHLQAPVSLSLDMQGSCFSLPSLPWVSKGWLKSSWLGNMKMEKQRIAGGLDPSKYAGYEMCHTAEPSNSQFPEWYR